MKERIFVEQPDLKSYKEIYDAFNKSEAAGSLKNIYRWSQFRTDESNERWVDALGPTANDYTHGWTMYWYGKDFLTWEHGRFTKEQEQTFLLGLIVHDWGEAIIAGADSVGDISAQLKTDQDATKESVIARLVIKSLDLSEDTKESMVHAYEQVVEGGDPALHHYFKALEKTEYVLTARHVFLNSKWERNLGRHGIANEKPMIGRVLVIDLAKIIDTYAKEYPKSIGARFKSESYLFDEMLRYTKRWLNETTEWAGKPVDHKTLAASFQEKWRQFKRTAKPVDVIGI